MSKIVEVTSQVLKSYEYPDGGWVLVRVHTEDGVSGIGECFVPDRFGSSVFAAKELIDRRLVQEVVGKDVLATTVIWERLYDACCHLYDRRGMMDPRSEWHRYGGPRCGRPHPGHTAV